MDLDLRRRFIADWRRTWEVHRSQVPRADAWDRALSDLATERRDEW
jgi:hypothetical protein